MDHRFKGWVYDWLIILSLVAAGAAGWWLTPDWSHPQGEEKANRKNPVSEPR